jgi:hypothetical protein
MSKSFRAEIEHTETHFFLYGFGLIDLSQSELNNLSHYLVEVRMEADDTTEVNVNGINIGSGTETAAVCRRAVVVVGKYMYFQYYGVTWGDSANPNFRLEFKVRHGW